MAAWSLVAVAGLYWLPGAGLVELLWSDLRRDARHDRLSRLAIAGAVSIALRPLLLLWCWTFAIPAGAWSAWVPAVLGAGVLAGRARQRRSHPAPHARLGAGVGRVDVLLGLVVALTIASRWIAVRGLLVPAWGDSVQHTMITQLLIENAGLFQSWAPYAPMESLTYHFGFHAMAAAWAEITGTDAPAAVLWVGQVTGVVAVLSLYPLTLQLTGGNRAAGAVALLVAGLLSPMPAFYASWGRYTQLAGQALLPIFVLLLDVVWFDPDRSPRTRLGILMFLLAGLCLTHYRVSLLAATAVVVWPLAGLWRWRHARGEWLRRTAGATAAGIAALLLIVPWLAVLDDGLLIPVYGKIASIAPTAFSFADALRAWSSIPAGASAFGIIVVILAVAVGMALRERAVLLILAWCALALVATNPFLLGLPGMGFVTNFAIGIAAYIPASILIGSALVHTFPWFERRPGGRALLAGALVIAAAAGFTARAKPVARDFQLLTAADLRGFEWIREHTPPDAHFQVNVSLAYGGKTAVGTDAGWWLPLLANRSSTLPPLLYASERMDEKLRHDVWALPTWLRWGAYDPANTHRNLCYQGVTHIFLGDKRGAVGADGEPLIPSKNLAPDPRMTLLFEADRAQVWKFDRDECGNWRQNVRRTMRR